MIRIPVKPLDFEIVLIGKVNKKRIGLSLSLFEVNVATPPRRKLDDIRFTARIGPLALGLIIAHYRGPQQEYELY
jgi:hypothetical protein